MLLLLLGDYYRVQLEIARLESNVPTLQIWHRKKMLVTGPLRTMNSTAGGNLGKLGISPAPLPYP